MLLFCSVRGCNIIKAFLSKKGEGYIDVCVCTVIVVAFIVIALNLFELVVLKAELDSIADDLIITAVYTGEFGDEFDLLSQELNNDYLDYTVEYGATEYFSGKSVQLGEKMWVIISKETTVKGIGLFRIPITVRVKRSGISEHYWKGEY